VAGVIEVAVGRAVGEAVKPLVERFQIALQRRGFGKSGIFTILERQTLPKSQHISGLGQLRHLPSGVTHRDIEFIVNHDEFHAICRELVAVCVFGATDANLKKVRSRLARLLSTRLVSTRIPPVALEPVTNSLYVQMLDVCNRTAEALIKSTNAPQEVLNWAYNVIIGDILFSIEAKLASPDADYGEHDDDWIPSYVSSFQNRHRNIDVPDFTSRRHAPYQDLFIEPSLLQLSIRIPKSQQASHKERAPAQVAFSSFANSLDRCVLLGDPGAGKSTSSTVAAMKAIDRGKVPFIVTLRDLPGPHFELASHLSDLLRRRYQINASPQHIRRILESGRAMIVFDGLDEILHNTDRVEMTKTVEAVAQRFPFSSILVTCRRIGYQIAQLDSQKFIEYVIEPLTQSQVSRYAHTWFELQFEQYGTSAAQLADDFADGAKSMPDLVENPLLLSFLCVLYRGFRFIPRTRPDLYRRCVELLLEWDEMRRIASSSQDVDMALIALSRIAHTDNGRGLTAREIKADLVPFLAEFFTGAHIEAERLVDDLLAVCRGRAWLFTDQGLSDNYEDIFSFTHASFREYFSALYRVRNSSDALDLAEHIYPSIITGSAQVYIQICIWLYDARMHTGASQVLLHLCQLVKQRNPAVDRPGLSIKAAAQLAQEERARRAVAIRSISDAADCVGLSRAAARQIVDLALEQVKQGDIGSAVSLLDINYRHGPAAREALLALLAELDGIEDLLDLRAIWFSLHIGTLGAAGDIKASISWSYIDEVRRTLRDNARLQRNLVRRSDIFETIAIQSGASPAHLYEGRPLEELFTQLLSRHHAPLRMGPESLTDWLLDCFSASERRRNNVAAAANLLRIIALGVRAAGRLPTEIEIPELHYLPFGNEEDRLHNAFRRISGYPQECRNGLAYFVAALASFPGSGVGQAYRNSGSLRPLRLTPDCQNILDAWSEKSSIAWRHKDSE
jgi:hypothetical protein